MVIACNHVSKAYNEQDVLVDVHFHIEAQDKVAIVGNNGVGKTTLFKIITNEISPDEGEVIYSKLCSIGYLKQHMEIRSHYSVFDELLSVFDEVLSLEKRLHELEDEIAQTHSVTLTLEYDNLRQAFEAKKGYEYKSLVRGILKGLGFDESIYNQKILQLSGGQKTRVALAKLLLEEPTVLLLDEPTNHLDIESIEWLEVFLRNYKGAVLIISHDRYFLDKVVNKVVHIEFGKSYLYYGNYDNYIIESDKWHETQVKQFEKQQQELNRQRAVIEKLKQFNREKSLKRARSREKMLSKQEVLEMPMIDDKPMNLILTPQVVSGNDVLSIKNLCLSYVGKPIFANINFDIKKGDKIAIVGPNGVGKTSLFRLIMRHIAPTAGTITVGTNVHIGYYDQEHSNLNMNNTILEELQNAFPSAKDGHIRNVLAAFLFTGEDVFQPLSTLSGGEKGRVALAKIMMSATNLLLLDEPTNHLDIMSKEVLERALTTYEGTVVYISHDRYFINQTATKILEMSNKGMILYLGDYDYYLEKKKELKLISAPSIHAPASANKLDWKKSKDIQSQITKYNTQLTKLQKSIEVAENEMSSIDEQLCDPDIYSNFNKTIALTGKKEKLEASVSKYYSEWEKIEFELNKLK
ncbi:MAG: ABC transporter [Epulopiscium sp. Nuni2H_MBin001]|nr:MAG: ABC transporter [Epulopiscium sp. Nuni2H_MBin001]